MKELLTPLLTIIVAIFIVFALMFALNACTKEKWNNGTCGICEVKYELRGVSDAMKYYVCPECGQEVCRY